MKKKILLISFTLITLLALTLTAFAESETGVFNYMNTQTVSFYISSANGQGQTGATGSSFVKNINYIRFEHTGIGSVEAYQGIQMLSNGSSNNLWMLSKGYYTFEFYVDIFIRYTTNGVVQIVPPQSCQFFMVTRDNKQITIPMSSYENMNGFTRYYFKNTFFTEEAYVRSAGVYFPTTKDANGVITWGATLYTINYTLEYEVNDTFAPIINAQTDYIINGDWSGDTWLTLEALELENNVVKQIEKELFNGNKDRFQSAEYIFNTALSFSSLFSNEFSVVNSMFTDVMRITYLDGIVGVSIAVGITASIFGLFSVIIKKGDKDG